MIPAANAANKVVRKKKTIAPNRPRMLCTLLICPEVIEFRFLARHGWHCHEQSPSFARSSRISPAGCLWAAGGSVVGRSEEHTSELQSLMRISYAVFCLKKTNINSLLHIFYFILIFLLILTHYQVYLAYSIILS